MITEAFTPKPVNQSAIDICTVCDELKELLLDKNKRYGDAALSPLRIFSKADATSNLLCRIDDKLSRIQNVREDEMEDPILDLLGYLVLLRISQRRNVLALTGMMQ
jgi:hypothetical protein